MRALCGKHTQAGIRKRQEQAIAVAAQAEPAPFKLVLSPVQQIIADTATAHGVSYRDVLGRSRKRPIVAARHAAIRAVHASRPDLSFPGLGRLFGGLDHKSVRYALGMRREAQ